MSGRCCGTAPQVFKDDKWTCSECDGMISTPDSQTDYSDVFNGYGLLTPKIKKCTCGAEKTYGPGATHTDYCDVK